VALRHTTGGPAALGSDTQLAGGTLSSASGLALGSGSLLEGSGDLAGAVTNGGSLSPGLGSAGTLTVTGAYTQSAAGRLVMEIGDAPSIQFDRLAVSGAAALDGALDVQLLGSLVPQPGQDFTLLSYGSHTGTFSSVTFEGQPVGGQFTLTYGAAALVLHVNALTTDVPPPGPQPPLELALAGHSGPWADAGFALSLPAAARVTLKLFDPRGRRVATLYRGAEPAGRFRYLLREAGPGLSGGVYFGRARVVAAGSASTLTARVVLVR
jgi:hypothetical protein